MQKCYNYQWSAPGIRRTTDVYPYQMYIAMLRMPAPRLEFFFFKVIQEPFHSAHTVVYVDTS